MLSSELPGGQRRRRWLAKRQFRVIVKLPCCGIYCLKKQIEDTQLQLLVPQSFYYCIMRITGIQTSTNATLLTERSRPG
jgi:hypothetical protein